MHLWTASEPHDILRALIRETGMAKELSPALKQLGQAIAKHPNPVLVAFLGFDLWLDVIGSGRVGSHGFTRGGKLATGDEDKETLVVPVAVIGKSIVINFDPTLPPDAFRLAP